LLFDILMVMFSGKRYFNDMLWTQAYNNNTLLLWDEVTTMVEIAIF